MLAFGVVQSAEVSKVSPTISQDCFLLILGTVKARQKWKFECFKKKKKKLEDLHTLAWSPGNSTLLLNTWRREYSKRNAELQVWGLK